MFGISFGEILLILIIALFIFGPEQLPQIATKLGRLFATVRNFSLNLRQQLYSQSGLEQIDTIRQEFHTTLSELKQQLTPQLSPFNADFKSSDEQRVLYHEYSFLYQPELDFERQPELFDESTL